MLAGGSDVGVESDAKRARTTSPRGPGGSASQAEAMYAKLQSMMEWRQKGLMDSAEFKAAKRELLGLQEFTHPTCWQTRLQLTLFLSSCLHCDFCRGLRKQPLL